MFLYHFMQDAQSPQPKQQNGQLQPLQNLKLEPDKDLGAPEQQMEIPPSHQFLPTSSCVHSALGVMGVVAEACTAASNAGFVDVQDRENETQGAVDIKNPSSPPPRAFYWW